VVRRGEHGVADEMQREISVEIEKVQKKVADSIERANELVCEARLALRQQAERAQPKPVKQTIE